MVPDIARRKRILCVEDHADTCELIAAILTGYEIHSANSVAEARDRFAQKSFSLVLLDHHLPDGTGLDFCREIRASDFQTPIVFFTSDPDLTAADVRIAGGQHLIEKDSNSFLEDVLAATESFSIAVL